MKVYAAVAILFLLILQLILKQKVSSAEWERKTERERSKLGQSKVAKSCKYLVDSIVQLIEN